MKGIFATFLCLSSQAVLAQKPPLTYAALAAWPRVDVVTARISNDGQYVSYHMKRGNGGSTLIVQAVDRNWQRSFPDARNEAFTEDGHHLVFDEPKPPGDRVGVLSLATDSLRYIDSASGFSLPEHGDGQWLACQRKAPDHAFVLHNLSTGEERSYLDVIDSKFGDSGTVLVLTVQREEAGAQQLVWVRVADGRSVTIAHGRVISQVVFDEAESRVAFLVTDSIAGQEERTLRYFTPGMDSAQVVAGPNIPGLAGFVVATYAQPRFGRHGQDILFNVSPPIDQRTSADTGVRVRVLASPDPRDAPRREPLLVVAHLDSAAGVVRLQRDDDHAMQWLSGEEDIDHGYVLAHSRVTGSEEEYLERTTARPDIYLVSTRDGSRRLLARRLVAGGDLSVGVSPRGRFLIWYDRLDRSWHTYDLVKQSRRIITKGIVADWYQERGGDLPIALGIVGWMRDDSRVLIQARYGVWALDPTGERTPLDLTRGIGSRRKMRLSPIDFRTDSHQTTFDAGDTLILSALNEVTKENGFYRLVLGGSGQLSELLMGPKGYYAEMIEAIAADDSPMLKPRKAKHVSRYLLTVQSPTEYPNFYVTPDFLALTPITHFAPQQAYNWYRSELVHWSLPGGRVAEGILYKPEDFDPRKQYPVIVFYYQAPADGLNLFTQPGLSNGAINIPWCVSNGYLVFVPNIYYTVGHPGRSALNSVESGAQYLARFPWVNAHRMGIQGHSYGGFETYYIVTHSSRFAAAAPSEGVTDLIVDYARQGPGYYERGQARIGASLYDRPDLYIENSPVLSARRVTTPLLILANKSDGLVSGEYGLEMLDALRRLGQVGWLLDYPGEEHVIEDPKNQLDYSIRLGEFFDHYLKGAPAPPWMEGAASSVIRANGVMHGRP